MSRRAYHFDQFELVPEFRRLTYRGTPLHLPPRAFDVLHVLVSAAGRAVTKDEIVESVWRGRAVSDANLAVAVSKIRSLLAAAAGHDHFLATLPGVGYQFTGEVHTTGSSRGEAANPNSQAFQFYRRGKYAYGHLSESGTLRAIAFFEKSLQIDPLFVPALSSLAEAYSFSAISLYLKAAEAFPKAREFAQRALAIDETHAPAYCTLAEVAMFREYDWDSSRESIRKALDFEPESPRGRGLLIWLDLFHRDMESALERVQQTLIDDPGSYSRAALLAIVLFFAERYDDSIEQFEDLLANAPDAPLLRWHYGAALTQAGRHREAIHVAPAARPDQLPQTLGLLGYAHGKLGEGAKAESFLQKLSVPSKTGVVSDTYRACIYCGLGRFDEALDALESAAQAREATLPFISILPFFRELRARKRFLVLLEAMNLRRH